MTIYDYTVHDIKGNPVSLSEYRGKVLLIVNTASKCGFTPQLGPLQALYRQYRDQGLEILAFPSNQFAGQEPESHEAIAAFYASKYGVEFPIMAKGDVNGPDAMPLYRWLRDHSVNKRGRKLFFWNRPIKWNFTKFLVSRHGEVVRRYEPPVEPGKLAGDIEKQLAEPVSPTAG